MVERFHSGDVTQTGATPDSDFDAGKFSQRMREDPEVMARAAVDLGEKVSDYIELNPTEALEQEQQTGHIQRNLANFAFVREAVANGDIKGITKIQQRRLEEKLDQLEEGAEDMVATMTGEVDPKRSAFRQLEQVFAEGEYYAPESIAPDLAAEIMEGSRVVADVVSGKEIKIEDSHRDYLSKKIAGATVKAISLPAGREEWERAA